MTLHDPHWPRVSGWLAQEAEAPDVVVVGVPTSSASISPSEAWRFPARFREVLAGFSPFDGERGVDLTDVAVRDHGDLPVGDLEPLEMMAEVDALTRDLDDGPVHVFIGGDNAITRPVARARVAGDLDRLGVLTFDAHHDVRVPEPFPSNGSPIRGLIDDGLPDDRVVQIGIHSFANSLAYRAWCQDHLVHVVTMTEVERQGIEATVDAALSHLAGRAPHIHVDFDIDVLDRAFAPACPGARPGGMSPRQLFRAAWLCGRHEQVVSADIVEVDPSRDVNDITAMSAATVFLNFVSGLVTREGPVT